MPEKEPQTHSESGINSSFKTIPMTTSFDALQRYYHRIRRLPIITHAFRARYDHSFKTRQANLFRGVFHSMTDARASAPSNKALGYDQPGAAAMYRDRMKTVFHTDYPLLFWLNSLIKPDTRVFDLGGHVGVSFYAYERYINFPKSLEWLVCDVRAVTNSGEALAKENNNTNLSFTNDYTAMDGCNVLFASGSLQYIEQDLSNIIAGLIRSPDHLLINLLPAHDEHACVTLQNIGTAYCPYRIFKADEFIASIHNVGYKLIDRWENPEKACDIPFHEEHSIKPYSGFYFEKELNS